VCALFLGRERSGKSTLQAVLRRMFPPEAVSAVPPANWAREYFVASLAGKRLNLVGELDDTAPIPAAAFKNVTGGGLLEGRHPTHRPFTFLPTAGHVFASNVLPPTTDRGEAFFRRWAILHFRHRVPDGAVDPDLVEKIAAIEMPGVMARAFTAAEAVAGAGRLRTTPAQDALLQRWRHAANPVLQWLLDDEAVELDPQAEPVPNREAHDHYRRWAAAAGFRHAFGRNHFLELLEGTGPSRGVVVKRRAVHGLRLLADG
jgi:putative DNA primase/helicase